MIVSIKCIEIFSQDKPKKDLATACRAWGGHGENQSMLVLLTNPDAQKKNKKNIWNSESNSKT